MGSARLNWPLLFRPLHDALIADCLATAVRAVGGVPSGRSWSPRVVVLRQVEPFRSALSFIPIPPRLYPRGPTASR